MKKLRGEPGENLKTSLELKKIADVAFIGYPNAGKSTLLNGLSNMNVTISAEPFTTLKPNVANLVFKNKKFKIADLPGLIDGSHQESVISSPLCLGLPSPKLLQYEYSMSTVRKGKGCGDLFLSMAERNDAFVLVVDINGFQLNATSPHSQQSKYSTYWLNFDDIGLDGDALVHLCTKPSRKIPGYHCLCLYLISYERVLNSRYYFTEENDIYIINEIK